MHKYVAEFIGTFALVFFGCSTVIFMRGEVGLLGVAFAFGLSVVAMAALIFKFSAYGRTAGDSINIPRARDIK
jgi:glycerol uptake facilitator-like aquaporin